MAQIVVELSADEAKLLAAHRKAAASQKQLETNYKKIGKASKGAGKEANDAFGARALATMKNYVAGIGAGTLAVGVLTNAMRSARAETQQTMMAVEGLTEARRRLLQVEMGGSKDVEGMNRGADALALKYGITREEARLLKFSARSEGYRGTEPIIAQLARANYATVEASQTAAGRLPTIFQGEINPVQSIAAAALAAKQSRLSNEELLQRLPKIAGGAKKAGSSPAETLAMLSVVAAQDDRAGEYVATLGNRLGIDPRFKGLGVMGGVEALSKLSDAERAKFMGVSKELNVSYDWLREGRGLIGQRTTALNEAMSDAGGFAQRMEAIALDPSTYEGRLRRAQVQYNRAKAFGELQRERVYATGGFARDSVIELEKARMAERGIGFVGRYTGDWSMQLAAHLNASPRTVAAAGRAGQLLGNPFEMPAAMRSLADTLQNLDQLGQVAEKLDRAADSLMSASEQAEVGFSKQAASAPARVSE